MPHRIVQAPAFTVMGLARIQSNDHPELIGKQWQDFYARGGIEQVPSRLSDQPIAVYTDYEGDHTQPYTLIIGCEINQGGTLPNGLSVRIVPAAKYAVFEAKGPQPAALIAAWTTVIESGLARAYTADFDRYRAAEDVQIFVAIR